MNPDEWVPSASRRSFTIQYSYVLTDFPQPGPKLLVLVEHPCELVTVVEHAHQPQEVFWRNRAVYFIVP